MGLARLGYLVQLLLQLLIVNFGRPMQAFFTEQVLVVQRLLNAATLFCRQLLAELLWLTQSDTSKLI